MSELRQMENQIRRIGLYRALLIARSVLSALLFISLSCYKLTGIPIHSPLYILLQLNILPFILTNTLTDRKNNDIMPAICHKYRYSTILYNANNISFLISIAFTMLWFFSLDIHAGHWTYILPLLCLVPSLCLYIFIGLYNTISLRRGLLCGKI